jgi:hypothetical protein
MKIVTCSLSKSERKKKHLISKSELLLQIKIVAVSLSYNLRTAIITLDNACIEKNTLNLFVPALKKGAE